MSSILRGAQETLPEYHFRLYETKEEHGLSVKQIADLLNKEYGTDYDESKFRKEYQALKNVWWNMLEERRKETVVDTDLAEALAKEQLKFNEKNRSLTKMLQDQRREYRKLLDFSGRFQHIQNEISEVVQSLVFNPVFIVDPSEVAKEKELIVLMSDWHFGTKVTSSRNPVNNEVLKNRVQYYLEETIKEINLHKIQTVNLAGMGDFVAGIIHVSSRTSAEEDVVRQIFTVTEVLSNFIANVATIVPNVKYINIVGNHGRVIPAKDAAMQEENFEKMILWYIKARLAEFTNIEYFEDEDGLVELDILGDKVIFAHGDNDRQASAPDKLSQMLGYVPQWVFLGHTHHDYSKSHGSTTVIVNPSLIGGDGYSIAGRFGIGAAQKLVTLEKTKFGVVHTVKTVRLN